MLVVGLIALPAFAEVQNVKVSGSIDSKMINRMQYDFASGNSGSGHVATSYKDNSTWFMTTTKIQVDADLTDNVSTCVRLLNERDWDAETASTTDVNLDLSYVTLKEMFYAPLTLKVGRQELAFGNGLVVAVNGTNDSVSSNVANQSSVADTNVAKAAGDIAAADLSQDAAFDAIRATLDYSPLVVDLVYAKISAGDVWVSTSAAEGTRDDIDLTGINAAYKFDDQKNSEIEAYVFAKYDKSDADGVVPVEDKVYTWGLRGSMEPMAKLVVDAEIAYQNGDYADLANNRTIDRKAWACDVGGVLAIDMDWTPKVGARYSYRSGQETPGADANVDVSVNTSEYKGWSTMFEGQSHGLIANKIFDGDNDGVDSNSHIINVNASIVPVQDMTVAVDYYHYILAEKFASTSTAGSLLDARYLNNGIGYEVKGKRELGDEIDLSLAYDYTEDVKLGVTAGFFLPGAAFQSTNDNMASTVMADVAVSF